MLDDSLFITDEIVEREVELADGAKHKLWFKQLPSSAFERHAIWANSTDENVQSGAPARLLAMGLCDSSGKPALTAERAELLKRPVLVKLLATLYEVNGYGKQKEKPGNASGSAATSGSGTSLRSRSAADPSRSGKPRSRPASSKPGASSTGSSPSTT